MQYIDANLHPFNQRIIMVYVGHTYTMAETFNFIIHRQKNNK
jgi:hypothetical protein